MTTTSQCTCTPCCGEHSYKCPANPANAADPNAWKTAATRSIDAINGAAEEHLAAPAAVAVADERLARGEAALHARKVAAAKGR